MLIFINKLEGPATVLVAKVYFKLCCSKLFNTVKLLFTNKNGNVIAGIEILRIKIWTWGQNLKMIYENFCRVHNKH